MKIHSLTGAFGFSTRVRDKQDGQSPGQSFHQQQDESQKENREEKGPQIEITEEEITKAVEAFQSDSNAQANGLCASMSGTGPGLRVVLKDGAGSVVRQLTGEEFLRLRDSSTIEGRIRGKILDQKL